MDLKSLILAVLLLFCALFCAIFVTVWNDILPLKPLNPIVEKTWFGPGNRIAESSDIKPYKIDFKKEVIE